MFSGKAIEMMVRSLLSNMGVDSTKIDSALDAATGFFQNATATIKRIEGKIDAILDRLPAKDCTEAVAYLPSETGDGIRAVTGDLPELLKS